MTTLELLREKKLRVVGFPYHNPEVVKKLHNQYIQRNKPLTVYIKKEPIYTTQNGDYPHAIAVYCDNIKIGYISNEVAILLKDEEFVPFKAGLRFITVGTGVLVPLKLN